MERVSTVPIKDMVIIVNGLVVPNATIDYATEMALVFHVLMVLMAQNVTDTALMLLDTAKGAMAEM